MVENGGSVTVVSYTSRLWMHWNIEDKTHKMNAMELKIWMCVDSNILHYSTCVLTFLPWMHRIDQTCYLLLAWILWHKNTKPSSNQRRWEIVYLYKFPIYHKALFRANDKTKLCHLRVGKDSSRGFKSAVQMILDSNLLCKW